MSAVCHTFSAFWLRSSVVSVLISLISDTVETFHLDVKLIFAPGGVTNDACIDASSRVASVSHCLRERHTSFGRIQSFHLISPHISIRILPSLCSYKLDILYLDIPLDVLVKIAGTVLLYLCVYCLDIWKANCLINYRHHNKQMRGFIFTQIHRSAHQQHICAERINLSPFTKDCRVQM